ncbi:PTS sugar transporter subunit IIA [Corynebacterium mastitidis]|uniref:Ascorbate-specific PTS system EIIA component n=1 Tax=Corynebacterium mastitidis TaxID=161890 RepID=A0A2N0X5M4_9CORY|nr:PTS sugar transporter subunit IIA [Corynebacterium mastitidis]MCH6196394.1 PTS sugar transporter subunit IIA [Corynebacterium mastitidis]PKF67981.1 PTS sugar transporter [Corynebacterium mastitidis]
MSMLNDLLPRGAVNLRGEARDWRSAIELAGGLLEESGAITPDYTSAMVRSVEEHGPYIVVAPGFALAHARPSEAVKETAISWVRLDNPVPFGSKAHDPVRLVVALAARDSSAHLQAMKELASLLGNARVRTQLEALGTEEELRRILRDGAARPRRSEAASAPAPAAAARNTREDSVPSKGKIYTVCGNGLGTSLFLKQTLEQVLDAWGWGPFLTVEATDTISAKGRAQEADFLLTSGAIAATLGDVGVPVRVIEDFTSTVEIDAALRDLYDV